MRAVCYCDCLNEFTIDARSVTSTGEGRIRCIISAPSGSRTEALIKNELTGIYIVNYNVSEEGEHTMDITYEGIPLPRTPRQVKAVRGCDARKVRAFGPGLSSGIVHQANQFTITTKGAGSGSLGLAIEGPSEAKMTCRDNRDGTCLVEYYASEAGEYDLTIKFADEHIPGSPFRIRITDEFGNIDSGKNSSMAASHMMTSSSSSSSYKKSAASSASNTQYNAASSSNMLQQPPLQSTVATPGQMDVSYSYSYGRKMEAKNSTGNESPQLIHSSAQYDSSSNNSTKDNRRSGIK